MALLLLLRNHNANVTFRNDADQFAVQQVNLDIDILRDIVWVKKWAEVLPSYQTGLVLVRSNQLGSLLFVFIAHDLLPCLRSYMLQYSGLCRVSH
jgi:hypothetical protein